MSICPALYTWDWLENGRGCRWGGGGGLGLGTTSSGLADDL